MTNPKGRNVEDVYELSPLQQEQLALARQEADPGALLRQTVLRLDALDVPYFEEAWKAVIARHPALRTSVHAEGLSKPVQVVHRDVPLPLEHYDWSALAGEEPRRRLDAALLADRRRPMSLATAPLHRLYLVRLGPSSYYFVWTWHPLVLDEASSQQALADALEHYRAATLGLPAELRPAVPYRDYVAHAQEGRAAAEAYWQDALRGARVPLPPPGDRPPAEGEPGPHRECKARLPAELVEDVRQLAARSQATLGEALVAAWALLLGRHAGTEDVVLGVRLSGRPAGLGEGASLVGPRGNDVPLRVALPPGETVAAWLHEVHARLAGAGDHAHIPAARLAELAGGVSGSPLFSTLIVREAVPAEERSRPQAGLGQLAVRRVLTPARPAREPLVLTAEPRQQALALRLEYAPGRVEEAVAGRLLADMTTALSLLVRHAGGRLGDIAPLRTCWAPDLLPLQASGPGRADFWAHPAGGAAWCYTALARQLGAERPFLAFVAEPPRQGERVQARVEQMAERYVHSLRAAQPRGPYRLGGWSTGGLVAYEMACRLAAAGEQVEWLGLLDTAVPDSAYAPRTDLGHVLIQFGKQMGLSLPWARLSDVPHQKLLPMILRRAKEAYLIPRDTEPQAFLQQVRLYVGHIRAARAYAPPQYPGRLTLIVAEQAQARRKGRSPRLGWENAAAEVEVHAAPGGHSGMLRNPHVEALARLLRATQPA